jgi:Skp family chaperone for outer membrane proteins
VKKNHWITVVVGIAIVLGIYAVPAVTQQQAQQAAQMPFYVAVIDVAQVIKAHPDFVQKQTALGEQVKAAEAEFQKRQEFIAGKQKALEASPHRPGSAEHQRALDEIHNLLADFEKDAKAQQRRFALANSQIMYDTYQDIKATIGRYATANNIAQVTDYREFEPNPAQPETVAEDMDQRLVWFNQRLNITQFIISQLYAARNLPMPHQGVAGNAAGGAARTAAPAPPAGQQQPLR